MRNRYIVLSTVALLASRLATAGTDYQTRTPYAPQQDMATYETLPAGFLPVYTQMLARHGSRGLTSFKTDLALYNLWLQAEREHALTPLGRQLGPDILAMMQANAVLGYGVPGITRPGYGNETQQGIAEHAGLARRMVARLPTVFAPDGAPRQVVVITSGKDRAVDSGHYFVEALLAERPALAPGVVFPASLAPLAEQDHATRPPGTDRYLLYFHKLDAQHDAVLDSADPLYLTYQASQAYQVYLTSTALRDKEAAVLRQPQVQEASRAALSRLFASSFLARLERGEIDVANTGTRTFTSSDGKFTSTLTGDGKEQITSSIGAALALYALYGAAADMQAEVSADFTRYLQPQQAAVFAWVNDAQDFYRKGPGMVEQDGVTWRMAAALLDDFFQEMDAIASGNLAHRAKLRFAHAETVMPFAAILGIPGMAEALPAGIPYTYKNSAWRGAVVAPMAANIQWDVVRDGAGAVAVRMLYNERETDFKPACDAARVAPGSHYYRYPALKACYSMSSASTATAGLR